MVFLNTQPRDSTLWPSWKTSHLYLGLQGALGFVLFLICDRQDMRPRAYNIHYIALDRKSYWAHDIAYHVFSDKCIGSHENLLEMQDFRPCLRPA